MMVFAFGRHVTHLGVFIGVNDKDGPADNDETCNDDTFHGNVGALLLQYGGSHINMHVVDRV